MLNKLWMEWKKVKSCEYRWHSTHMNAKTVSIQSKLSFFYVCYFMQTCFVFLHLPFQFLLCFPFTVNLWNETLRRQKRKNKIKKMKKLNTAEKKASKGIINSHIFFCDFNFFSSLFHVKVHIAVIVFELMR